METKFNCFMDFDGTIVCNKERLYKFFVDNIDEKYKNALTIEEFWWLKKMGIHEIDWINNTYGESFDKQLWNEIKKKNIESLHYLKFNHLFMYSKEVLQTLNLVYDLILITRRSNRENFFRELETYDIKHLFKDILVLEHGDKHKSELIRSLYDINPNDIMIGDTEDDLKAAKDLNILGILVKSGIRSDWILNKYFKDHNKLLCVEGIHEIDFDKLESMKKLFVSPKYKLGH